MKIKTSELIGDALDWAVGTAYGEKLVVVEGLPPGRKVFVVPRRLRFAYRPSRSWGLGGRLLEVERIAVQPHHDDTQPWEANGTSDETGALFFMYGDTPLVAICRCYVAIKLGGKVEVPDELCA